MFERIDKSSSRESIKNFDSSIYDNLIIAITMTQNPPNRINPIDSLSLHLLDRKDRRKPRIPLEIIGRRE